MNIVNGRPKHGLRLSIVVVVVFMLATPAWADFQAGFDAYNGGDYDTALKEFRPLAERGKAVAQWSLGFMYERGQGVPQDYQEAMMWYRLAAEQGSETAQLFLGEMYCCVKGAKEDLVQAHKWFNLAASQGRVSAKTAREELAERMTPDQIAEAQTLAREWTPTER